MTSNTAELNERFALPGQAELPPDILGELESILRLHSIAPEELYFKWESYCLKMGSEETKLDLTTARAFKKDIQEMLERDSRGKAHLRSGEKKGVHATPRNASTKGGDVFDMLDATPYTLRVPSINGKRKAAYETPANSKVNRSLRKSSPTDGRATPLAANGKNGFANGHSIVPFADRPNPGQVTETLNEHLPPHEAPIVPPAEARVKLTANTDLKKFAYRPMAVHLSEASEVLDDRIDEFAALIQEHHRLEDAAVGDAAAKSTREIVAVGRIGSDTHDGKGKLNAASMVLEMSRRVGAGLRVPLRVEAVQSHGFFPGQIVAAKGINASGEYFSVSEILEIPLLPIPTSHPSDIDAINAYLGLSEDDETPAPSTALNILIAAGPYTADDNLAFEPLQTLCDRAAEAYADVLILIGPLLDIEHPLIATGDIDLPEDSGVDPDQATLNDVFRTLISAKLRALAQANPSITIVTVPSVRDAINKHVSWPQDSFSKRELGFPKQARMCTNPVTISLNETVVAISAQDILHDLRREEVFVGRPKETNILARLPRHVIEQRHFFPVYPPTDRGLLPRAGTEEGLATGTPLDTSYAKLGEWLSARPDVLICPSALSPFVKVVENVLVINPGPLSKRQGPGTFVNMALYPRRVSDEERTKEEVEGMKIDHQVFERARVDLTRI